MNKITLFTASVVAITLASNVHAQQTNDRLLNPVVTSTSVATTPAAIPARVATPVKDAHIAPTPNTAPRAVTVQAKPQHVPAVAEPLLVPNAQARNTEQKKQQ
ncbi:MAG: hypothetical protein JSS75_02070 [Bacteroidetes bacterium]|nr:hypothetical protein [Bacteroidota bacterium]